MITNKNGSTKSTHKMGRGNDATNWYYFQKEKKKGGHYSSRS